MFLSYERCLQRGLVGAGPVVPVAGLVGSGDPFGEEVAASRGASAPNRKAAGIFALRLAGFENVLL